MTKSSADVEREVEATRGQIDRTVEALKDKMQPKELFEEATRVMGGASNKVLTTVVEQAKENPIPIALIGVGIAWWALGQRKSSRTFDPYAAANYYDTYEGYDEDDGVGRRLKRKATAAVTTAKFKTSAAVDKAKDGLATARTGAADGVETMKGRVAGLTGAAREKVGAAGQQVQAKYQETLDTEPLILGAIALAVGAAIGASIPASRAENRLIGPHRDRIVGRGKDAARTGLDEARSVAERAYGQVKEELHRQTGPDGEGATLTEKAKKLADAGVSSVRDDVDNRLQH
jgi:hypothetical protein